MSEPLAFVDLKSQRQVLDERLREAVGGVLERGQYIMGPEVGLLERRLAEYAGVREAITCANGTDALVLPLMAWEVGPGDAVFVPPFTFMSTAEVVSLRRASPVFVDIDPVSYNIDPAALEARIQAVKKEGRLKPRAVIAVDLFGLPCDYQAIEAVAKKHDLMLLEDAAQAFGGRYRNRPCGSFGQAAGVSFFPAKPLGCYGDGGAVFTNEAALAEKIRSLRVHGQGGHKYEHVGIGLNSRLDTLQAAILLVKLDAFPGELEARQKVAQGYERRLKNLAVVPRVPADCLSAWAQYTVRTPADRRADIMRAMSEAGIPTMIYYPLPLHLQPAYAGLGGRPGDFPEAEKAAREVMSLPMHPYLTGEQQDRVAGAFKKALA